MNQKEKDDAFNELSAIGVEFEGRENEKEVMEDILKILKTHGVVHNELENLFEKITLIFDGTAKL